MPEATDPPIEEQQASTSAAQQDEQVRSTPNSFVAFARANARTLISVALLVAGIVAVTMGWYGAAYTNILTEQIPYLISGGLLGLGLIIVAGFMASSASVERQNEQLRRDIVRALASARPYDPDAASAPSTNGRAYFALPDGHSAHVAGCPILEGKEGVRKVTAAERADLAPCKLCVD